MGKEARDCPASKAMDHVAGMRGKYMDKGICI
jgi:hypothetical protein